MRKSPYTEKGIKRLKCFRCNNKASFQWNICSDNNTYRPICLDCDIKLNELVLEFMRFKNTKQLIENYKNKKLKLC